MTDEELLKAVLDNREIDEIETEEAKRKKKMEKDGIEDLREKVDNNETECKENEERNNRGAKENLGKERTKLGSFFSSSSQDPLFSPYSNLPPSLDQFVHRFFRRLKTQKLY
jgi:hypothetical protein